MKKRSLIVSIAMLLVSAIVLTSSTYAWFATGTTAKVSNIEASIVNNDGTIALSVTEEGPYKTSLNINDFMSVEPAFFPKTLNPVSLDIFGTGFGVSGGKIVQDITADSPTYGEMIFTPYIFDPSVDNMPYITMIFYAKANKDCTVEVEPTFGTTNVSYAYAAVWHEQISEDKSVLVFHTTEGRSYYPIVEGAPLGIDSNNNGIMDSEDKNINNIDSYSGLCNEKVVATNKPFNIELKVDEPYLMCFYIWAEGQDPACRGPISDGFVQFGIDFEIVE